MAGILSQFRLRTVNGTLTVAGASPSDPRPTVSPAPSSLRRQRESASDCEDDEPISSWDQPPSTSSVKRRKLCVQDVARRLRVPARNLEAFAELSVADMLITAMAALEHMGRTRDRDALVEEVQSPALLNLYKSRLYAQMMSPGMSAYVTNMMDRTLDLVKASPELYGLTEEMVGRAEVFNLIATPTSSFLTTIRGSMKQKILLSITDKASVESLVKKLCKSASIVPTEEMHPRAAFLRKALVAFEFVEKRRALGAAHPAPPVNLLTSTPPSTQPRLNSYNEEDEEDTRSVSQETERDELAASMPATGTLIEPAGSAVNPLHYGPNDFWSFVDDLLQEMRDEAKEKHGDNAEAVAYDLDTQFKAILEADSGGSSSTTHPKGRFYDWQIVMNENMSRV